MTPFLSSIIHSVATDNLAANWVFSPASYLEAMSSLALCVDGINRDEVTHALCVQGAPDVEGTILARKHAFAGLDETFNCLLHAEEYRDAINTTVTAALARLGSDIKTFTTPDSAIAEVNRLVEEKTHGRIRDLANRDNVTALTKFIILNCVYFKRDWAHPLKPHWATIPFTNVDGSVTQVKPLAHDTYYHYYEDSLFDLVELPYKDSTACCYLFVPTTRGSVFEVLNSFDTHFARIRDVKRQWEVRLKVPAFKVETTAGLNAATRLAGVKAIFDHTKDWKLVDWTKLDPEALMWVSDIVQKAYLDFNEKGTEAAAATGIFIGISGCMMRVGDPPPVKVITADRSFVFCLADSAHKDVPLFVGVVNHV